MEKGQASETLLSDFLKKLESLPVDITDNLLKFSNDEDEKNVIKTYAPTLKKQFSELSNYVREINLKASKQSQAEVEQFLKIASPSQLMSDMTNLFPSTGSLAGILGMDGIAKEVKKIMKEVISHFQPAVPSWIDVLLTVIDEMLNVTFSGGSTKTRIAMSQIEQNHLAEQTQLAKLKKATKEINSNDSEEQM